MTIISNQLSLAVRLARSGEREQARNLFSQIVEVSPTEVEAWLWLSELADNLDDQVAALDKAVHYIDAKNERQPNLQERLNAIRKVATLPPPAELPGTAEEPAPAAGGPALHELPQTINTARDRVVQTTALQWAERLVVLGEKREAARLLETLLEDDPGCEEAMALFCEVVEHPEEKRRALERILAQNPGSQEIALQIEQIEKYAHPASAKKGIFNRISHELAQGMKLRLFSR